MDIFINSYNDWLKLAKSYVGDLYAKDIVNEAYIKLHGKKELNRSYIFLTVRSICIDYLREKNQVIKVDIQDRLMQPIEPTDREMALQRIKAKIDKEIDTWHWYDAKLFRLYKDNDNSLRQIASETDISLVSIFNTIKNCKEVIRLKFQKDYDHFKNEQYERIL